MSRYYPFFPQHKVGDVFRTQWGFAIVVKRPIFGSVYMVVCVFEDDRIGHVDKEEWGISTCNNKWIGWEKLDEKV